MTGGRDGDRRGADSGPGDGEPGIPVILPLRMPFRGMVRREIVLLSGPAGWGEFSPFLEYDDDESLAWWRCAIEAAEQGWPSPVRERVEVNTTVPAVDPDTAARLVVEAGAGTVKVKVAEPGQDLARDLDRLRAVRGALGPRGRIRVDANAAWDLETAVDALARLERASGGLEYAEQPVAALDDLARVRRRSSSLIAADESIRRAGDPLDVVRADAADVAVLKVAPLGGVRSALAVAEAIGIPCVVTSAIESSVGLAAGLALAGALPELPFACGLGTAALLAGDVVPGATMLGTGGELPVPERAPTPAPELIERYRARGARRDFWTARVARMRAATG